MESVGSQEKENAMTISKLSSTAPIFIVAVSLVVLNSYDKHVNAKIKFGSCMKINLIVTSPPSEKESIPRPACKWGRLAMFLQGNRSSF